MRKILLDAYVPHGLRKEVHLFEIETAQLAGVDQLSDGDLLKAVAGKFDVLITLDRNLTFQNKLVGHPICVVVLRVAEQTPEALRILVPRIEGAVQNAKLGEVMIIGP